MLSKHVREGDNHLVFNCHGYASRPDFQTPHLSIGTVIHPGNIGAFTILAPIKLRVIWISACSIASSATGEDFCKKMARNAECYVVAAMFHVTQNVKSGHVEDTAGASWKYFDPQGSLVGRLDFINLGKRLGFTYEKK
jgi:hypothetical protein